LKRRTLLSILPASLILLIGLVAYWPTLRYNYYWEDPFDIGQAQALSYVQVLFSPNSNSYYRPLTLALMKLLMGSGPVRSPLPFHISNVGWHLLAAVMLYGAARCWFHDRNLAFLGSLIFLLYPPAFEATARASSTHSLFVVLAIGAMWLYALGRERRQQWPLWAALGLAVLAVLAHENGVLLPPMILALELYLRWQRRVERFSWLTLLFFIPAILFGVVWLSIPKSAGPPQLGLRPIEALYVSQGLSFPLGRAISQTGGLGLSKEWQAGAAAVGAIAVWLILADRKQWPALTLAVIWWGLAISLAGVARPIEYLAVSPRVMYFGSFAASLAWARLAAGSKTRVRVLGWIVVVVIILQSWMTLREEVKLYEAGSKLMDQIVAVGRGGGRLLYVNVPDRFEYREPLYPIGYWGMLLAPVSQDLGDFVRFATGVQMETESLSDFPLMAAMMAASPYRVNTRGSDAHASDLLYEKILWADEVYWTDYHPDGAMTLKAVGDVSNREAGGGLKGQFDEMAQLMDASAAWEAGALQIVLQWRSLSPAQPNDTIFIHILDSSGALVGQRDGDSLNGLLPLSAWRPGHIVVDRRTVVFDAPLPPGEYRVTVGVYNRVSGQRYPAFEATGARVADDELSVLAAQR
jgi:hypothetical protein